MAYETTAVPVERSQAAIRKLLVAHGAASFEFGEGTVDGVPHAAIGFVAHGRRVRMRVAHKAVDRAVVSRKMQRARSKTWEDVTADLEEQEARRIWRVVAWNLKARLEAVDEGVETFEEAFLAHLLDEHTGLTIYEQLVQDGRVELDGPMVAQLAAGAS